jgi:SAM-dependent methyltransferase
MSDSRHLDSIARFTGRASLYARYRPSYPAEAVDLILERCALEPGAVVVDVGCGTGISSRLLTARGLRVIGIEPNAEMRAEAQAEVRPHQGPPPQYLSGKAEATGLAAGTAAAVVAAQAFHWFDPSAALAEFHRILQPNGWVALLWNERDETDPATADFGQVMRTGPHAAAVEANRGHSGEALLSSSLFIDAERVVLHHNQDLDEEGLLGRAFSASYAPREPVAAAAFADSLRKVFAQYQRGGRFVLRYETSVYLARRQPASSSCHPSGGPRQ